MKRLVLTLIVALSVAACSAPQAAAPFIGIDGKPLVSNGVTDNSVQEALTANPDACAKAGGAMQPVCRMQKPMCVVSFPDAGTSCTDGKQCASGRCMAKEMTTQSGQPATGVCKANTDPCGCFQTITNGVADPGLCVD